MSKDRLLTTLEVTEKLIGQVEPIGETNYDNKCLINIDELGFVAGELICTLIRISEKKESQYLSEKFVGKKAQEYVEEIKGFLKN